MSETTVKLNDGQRKLAENNHNLIYSFLRSKNLSLDSTEDWYGSAAVGLCKAALWFDPNAGVQFSTFAYRIMSLCIQSTKRQAARQFACNRSLDEPIPGCDDKTLGDTIRDPNDAYAIMELYDIFERAKEGMNGLQHTIIEHLVDRGESQSNVAFICGVSRSYVSKIYNDWKKYVRHMLSAAGFKI